MLDIIKNRFIYLGAGAILVLFSIFSTFFLDANFGIDMTGGTQTEYSYKGDININDISQKITNLSNEFNKKHNDIINSAGAYTISGEKKIVVVVGFASVDDEKKLETFKNEFKQETTDYLTSLNKEFVLDKYINIGKSFGDYIKKTAFLTLGLAIIGISVYISFAFSGFVSGLSSISFALITGITLLHDVIVATGLYIFTSYFYKEFQIDTFFITALLTILGYSINDTIVVLDRIRDNLKRIGTKKTADLAQIINVSVYETLKRSLFTSSTVLIVLVCMFFFGPESLKGFMLALIYGTVFGTYSSIFISAPLLYELNKNKEIKFYEKPQEKHDDKIIV